MEDKKRSRFGLGLVIGSMLGALAGVFLAPKSGKENREAVLKKIQELKKTLEKMEIDKKAKEIFGVASEEGIKILTMVKEDLMKGLDMMEERLEDIDKEKYAKMVKEAIERVSKETKETTAKLKVLEKALMQDWSSTHFAKALKQTTKKVASKK